MAFVIPPDGRAVTGRLLHDEGEEGWAYENWRLSAESREKILAAWPELDLPWIDLAAREFEAAWSRKGSNREGFVGWREDIEKLSNASERLLKALEDCATPARHSLGTLAGAAGEETLYGRAVGTVGALVAETGRLKQLAAGVDARSLPHPMPDLIIKLARQLRYSGRSWDKRFKPELTRLTTLVLDGLGLRHSIDIRSGVKDALKSGDQRLEKLR
ncbi:hypothetical protein [Qipengyuania aquimaris]|uniref:hypothetical protein n=1 Tax=Qipengyuania aquimaris TaxID=255984 RepID=UPI001FCFB083|nr:hypothetical protein [Qipengyuania aquimaris]UOR15833.1 hypothetical protein LCM05_01985 [Qipengyuania aquimaris]